MGMRTGKKPQQVATHAFPQSLKVVPKAAEIKKPLPTFGRAKRRRTSGAKAQFISIIYGTTKVVP
jgi:hypothetical protein